MSEAREYMISREQIDRDYTRFCLQEAVENSREKLGWWRTFVVLVREMIR